MSNAYTHPPLQNALSPNLAWPVQDAKARFSEFLDTCLAKGPQVVTRRGTQTAVLVPFEQWQRLSQQAQLSLKDVLLQGIHPKLLAGEEVSDEELGIESSERDMFSDIMDALEKNPLTYPSRPIPTFED
jgi:prevent-host-death family protein